MVEGLAAFCEPFSLPRSLRNLEQSLRSFFEVFSLALAPSSYSFVFLTFISKPAYQL